MTGAVGAGHVWKYYGDHPALRKIALAVDAWLLRGPIACRC
jgi:hypothetical protein